MATIEVKKYYVGKCVHVDPEKHYVYRDEPGLGEALFEFDSSEDAKKMWKNGCSEYDTGDGCNWIMPVENGLVYLDCWNESNNVVYVSHEEVVKAENEDLLLHILYHLDD